MNESSWIKINIKFTADLFQKIIYLDLQTCIVMIIYFDVVTYPLCQLNLEILVGQPFAT